jgi:pimeloyl-ACP methyl ester carboxylesterase
VARELGRAEPIRRSWDIVLFDQRGAGESNPLACNFPMPGGRRSQFGSLFPRAFVAACLDSLRSRADLTRYTTAAAADDVAEVLDWLGYERVNVWGGSYGTRAAQVFLKRHEGRVRAALLTAVLPVDQPMWQDAAPNVRDALDRLLGQCLADSGCGARYPDVRAEWDRVVARLRSGPVTVRVRLDSAAAPAEVPFSLSDLGYAVRGMLYGPLAARLPRLIHASAAGGDLTTFAQYYVERTAWVASPFSFGLQLAVYCAEDIPFVDTAVVARYGREAFLGDYLFRQHLEACRMTPIRPVAAADRAPVRSRVPVLLFAGEHDPVTPPRYAERVAEGLSESRLIVWPGQGHSTGGLCSLRIVLDFFRAGSARDLDTSCVATGGQRVRFDVGAGGP